MSKLPAGISGADCVKALIRAGFEIRRQKGSHVTLRRTNPFAATTVPMHPELDRGMLRAIIKQAGLTVDEFVALLGK